MSNAFKPTDRTYEKKIPDEYNVYRNNFDSGRNLDKVSPQQRARAKRFRNSGRKHKAAR